jgi:hypothetical protein
MALLHSAAMNTGAPRAFRRARWSENAAISSPAERVSRLVDHHPPIRSRPWRASKRPSAAASRGNLPPSSTPSKPIAAASPRMVSTLVSPPNSGMSSLVQAMGLTP